jgi:hypothetical protein
MKKLFAVTSLLFSGSVFAHVSHANSLQHSSEHLLLAALLIPVAWYVVRKVFK